MGDAIYMLVRPRLMHAAVELAIRVVAVKNRSDKYLQAGLERKEPSIFRSTLNRHPPLPLRHGEAF